MDALFNRCNILLRSPALLADDFIRVYKKGITHVSPSHDMQMFGKKYYEELFAAIQSHDIKGGLYLECFQLPTKAYIDAIAETFDPSKTVLAISPISGNEKLRRENGKLFSNDDFYEIVDYIVSKNITLQLYYTLNPVGETREQFNDTYFQIKFCHELYGLKGIYYQNVVLDPLAGIRDIDGTEPALNSFMDYYQYCQLPADDYSYTGYNSHCEVPYQEKKKLYLATMGYDTFD